MKTFFFPLLISILVQISFGQIENSPPKDSNKTILEADNEVYFDEELQRMVAAPNARLESGPVLLLADRIEYDANQSEAFAEGKVILSDGDIRLLARRIKLNLITGDFNASEIKFGIYPWAIQSDELSRQNSTIHGLNSSLYLLGKEKNEPNLLVRELRWNEEEEVIRTISIKSQ